MEINIKTDKVTMSLRDVLDAIYEITDDIRVLKTLSDTGLIGKAEFAKSLVNFKDALQAAIGIIEEVENGNIK